MAKFNGRPHQPKCLSGTQCVLWAPSSVVMCTEVSKPDSPSRLPVQTVASMILAAWWQQCDRVHSHYVLLAQECSQGMQCYYFPRCQEILLGYRGNHYKDHTSQRVPMLLERAALSDPQSQSRVAALRSLLLAITVMSLQNPNLPNKNHPSNWRELKLRETSKSRNEEQEVVICEGFFRALFSLANLPRSSQSSCFSSRLSSDALNFTSRCN